MREREYSDEVLAQVLESVEDWVDRCRERPAFQSLPQSVQEEFHYVAVVFAEMMYNYHLETPDRWTAASLQEVLTGLFPRKLLAPPEFFQAVEPALSQLFAYLLEAGVLTERKAAALTARLRKAAPVMCRRAAEADDFSPVKQLLRQGMEAGLDPEDADALEAFLQDAQLPPLFPSEEPAQEGRGGQGKPRFQGGGETDSADALRAAPAQERIFPLGEQIPPASPVSPELWAQLYEVAENIKKLAPWERLWDTDLVTLLLPGRDEPVYCSAMGRNGVTLGIGVYPGHASLIGLLEMAAATPAEPPYIHLFRQDCLMCYFGDREEVEPRDREVMKALGLKFRGRNQWIYFRAMRPGYYPWFLDAQQAELLLQALQNFAMACTHLLGGQVQVDFESGETLLRYYDRQQDLWMNAAAEMPPVPSAPRLAISDELQAARLKKQKSSGLQVEWDFFYLPTPIQEHKEDIPYLPGMVIAADRDSGAVLAQAMVQPGEYVEQVVMDLFCGHILEHGRPGAVYVRGAQMEAWLSHTCEAIGVELIARRDLPAVNALLEDLLSFIG